ncbi:transcriptional regulator TACO1-like protein [Amylocarpus encephaloides]|uniref:Transcriptional regulator TACO1-like protein n=1 Tax=Amylocarpus encephaloides TaxID=45428 RepID=A0A9P7YTH2_9HELO|nr:transcriptional regulator TACO1-like protein [Amylocarpus encephaloides]
MASFSRGLRSFTSKSDLICSRCLQFSTTSAAQSGHNRWSKIKHDKMGADAKRSKSNGFLSEEIARASKMGGPDPNLNYQLATALVTAKKAGFPKANMEAAIARGQGKSASGAALEPVTLETILPPQVAMVIEAETDNTKRCLSELRLIIKESGGIVSPTSYLFQKKGRVAFEKHEKLGVDEVLDEAIEAGAEDVEAEEDGSIVVWTQPKMTTAAAETLQKNLGLKLERSDIIWEPNEDTKVQLDSEEDQDAIQALKNFLERMRDHQNVNGMYANFAQGNLNEEAWEDLQAKLD